MKYYKHEAESSLGEGMVYIEVDPEGYASRQIEVYGVEIFWSNQFEQKDEEFMIADQRVSDFGLEEENKIQKKEFEKLWREAREK